MAYEFQRHGDPRPCLTINPEPPTAQMTVPIVGVPRGGTTMVAAVVHAMGVDLGPAKDLAAFTFEDQAMNHINASLLLAYIAKRNCEHEVWGWKDPLGMSGIRSIFFALRSPRVIVVFRDMAATLEAELRFDATNGIMPARHFASLARGTLQWWTDNMNFIADAILTPMLLVSYEGALRMPDIFVRETADFLGITLTHEIREEALARISPSGGYLRVDERCHPIQAAEDVIDGEGEPDACS